MELNKITGDKRQFFPHPQIYYSMIMSLTLRTTAQGLNLSGQGSDSSNINLLLTLKAIGQTNFRKIKKLIMCVPSVAMLKQWLRK